MYDKLQRSVHLAGSGEDPYLSEFALCNLENVMGAQLELSSVGQELTAFSPADLSPSPPDLVVSIADLS